MCASISQHTKVTTSKRYRKAVSFFVRVKPVRYQPTTSISCHRDLSSVYVYSS